MSQPLVPPVPDRDESALGDLLVQVQGTRLTCPASSGDLPSYRLKRQREAPCGSAVPTPKAVWNVNRYRCHGGGPALGAPNGAVNALSSTSAGHPCSRYLAATASRAALSVTLTAVPSRTRCMSVAPMESVAAGFSSRLRVL